LRDHHSREIVCPALLPLWQQQSLSTIQMAVCVKTIGGYLFFFGVGSILLHFFEMEFIILTWIETWGDTVAWAIRGGMVAIGGALWLFGGAGTAESTT